MTLSDDFPEGTIKIMSRSQLKNVTRTLLTENFIFILR